MRYRPDPPVAFIRGWIWEKLLVHIPWGTLSGVDLLAGLIVAEVLAEAICRNLCASLVAEA